MKKLAIALMTVFVSTQASARTMKPFVESNLNQFSIQPNSYLSRFEIEAARATLTVVGPQNITLRLDLKQNCPPGLYCAAVMPEPIEVTVPVQSVEIGACGETIYKGAVDKTRLDGARNELTLVDHRTEHGKCRYIVAMPPTQVILSTYVGRPYSEETHSFTGEALH